MVLMNGRLDALVLRQPKEQAENVAARSQSLRNPARAPPFRVE